MMQRMQCLKLAGQAITERGVAYGPPAEYFAEIASLWSVLFGRIVTEHQVAMAMIAVKLVRLRHLPGHADSWVDIAGYAAIGFELGCAAVRCDELGRRDPETGRAEPSTAREGAPGPNPGGEASLNSAGDPLAPGSPAAFSRHRPWEYQG